MEGERRGLPDWKVGSVCRLCGGDPGHSLLLHLVTAYSPCYRFETGFLILRKWLSNARSKEW